MLAGLAAAAITPAIAARGAASADLVQRLKRPPIICAHRGGPRAGFAENALATLRATAAAGPFMLEIDLAFTRDGEVVLMHDAAVTRTTDGRGRLELLSAADVRGLHLRSGDGLLPDPPPTFDAVLKWARGDTAVLLMLDIKRVPPERVMAMVGRAGIADRVLLLTFDPDTAAAAFAARPEAMVSVLVHDPEDLARYRAMAHGHRMAAYVPRDLGNDLMRDVRHAGVPVVTDLLNSRDALVDTLDPHAVRRDPPTAADYAAMLRALPADIVVTNRPLAVQAALRR
ncbi:glycerophosphodiester phosphodiesterase family protein [Rhizosaccharibacter radicis]|uniref:Glycerophosphodiester phosphodiesterase family protein n=1 Tax=Rhizosaccharibacter radicis TaxID=2782605 RepID=A0ABT1VXD7_9PROT|nr:glycerophosphodiester phosphodiesterase family protein [Acetobacteraceae bacterium KSS12]